jgi:hypothetical protein
MNPILSRIKKGLDYLTCLWSYLVSRPISSLGSFVPEFSFQKIAILNNSKRMDQAVIKL